MTNIYMYLTYKQTWFWHNQSCYWYVTLHFPWKRAFKLMGAEHGIILRWCKSTHQLSGGEGICRSCRADNHHYLCVKKIKLTLKMYTVDYDINCKVFINPALLNRKWLLVSVIRKCKINKTWKGNSNFILLISITYSLNQL